jgi:hypothetical protein
MTPYEAKSVIVCVGTKKGLFLFRSSTQRDRWQLSGPFLQGNDINHVVLDQRTCTLYPTVNDPWFGSFVSCSSNLGATWQDAYASRSLPITQDSN